MARLVEIITKMLQTHYVYPLVFSLGIIVDVSFVTCIYVSLEAFNL